jgi:hypothetical protein
MEKNTPSTDSGNDSNISEDSSFQFESGLLDNKVIQSLLQISEITSSIILHKKWKFVVNEQDLNASQVADPNCMLGAVLWQAEKNYRIAYSGDVRVALPGATLGVKFIEDAESSIGARPVIESFIGMARSPMILFLLEVLTHAQENYPIYSDSISLDQIVQDFFEDQSAGLISWVAAAPNKSSENSLINKV